MDSLEGLSVMVRHQRWCGVGGTLLAMGALALTAVPAMATTNTSLTVDNSSGTTSCTSPPAPSIAWSPTSFGFGTITLSGSNQTPTATNTLTVTDSSGCGDGWNVTATGTELYNGAEYITSQPSFPVTSWTCSSGSTCTLPSNTTSAYSMPVGTTAPTATTFVTAATGTGMGAQQTSEAISLLVPASAYAGTYSATWTFTSAVGP